MQLELSRKAQADLDDIRNYGAERFGAARALRYLDAVEQAFRLLLTHPEIGMARDEARPGLRALSCERHRIFYKVEAGAVTVVRILHDAMDTGGRV